MKNIIKIAYVFFVSVFVGCKGLSDEQIVDRYYLVAIDYIEENTTLSYQLEDGNYVGVVEETVFAVGFNDNYIIAKQHPSNNREVTNYYIISIYKENTLSPEKGVIGPLTEQEFIKKREELEISDELTFMKEISDLK